MQCPIIFFSAPGRAENVSYDAPAPSIHAMTSRRPLVIVPVLSENKILTLPEVSIPISFLTNTLDFNIFFILIEHTIAIMSGSPSGTATTITTIPMMSEDTRSDTTWA